MVIRDNLTDYERSFNAAATRFPDSEFTIRRLLRSSEAFRDLCTELAEAEQALEKVPENVAALREARQQEWRELVNELAAEVERVLKGI
jgi:hypothetical protein